MTGHYFEDFFVGQELVHAVPRTLSEGDRALYIALTGDRNAISSAETVAKQHGLEASPLHDWLVFHTVFGKTVTDISLNAVANLGYAEVRFLAPVYAGDTLAARSKVIGVKQNSSGKTGIVWVETTGTNQRDEAVLSYKRWVMVNKRDESAPAPETHVPALEDTVDPASLLGARLPRVPHSDWDRGRPFADYSVGEVIVHDGAMTVEEADHMSATRLYQNTAKVHFDGKASARFGRRLVYGGHVISLCSALSYAGLEANLGVLAMNGGTHAAPIFAGDTLYARSEVLDVRPVSGRSDLGLLRTRLVGVKNDAPDVPLKHEVKGRMRHHPSVVLDVDLWLAVRA